MSQFAVLDASGLLDPSSVGTMISAVRKQLRDLVAPSWDRVTLPDVFEVFKEKDIGPEDIPVFLMGDPGDRAGLLGAHFEEAGRPVARVYVAPILRACPGKILWDPDGGPCVASVLSHEVVETEIDSDAKTWIETREHDDVALETCDPDNSATFPLTLQPGLTVGLANWAFPRWFDVTAIGGKCDYLSHLPGPFQIAPNGYAIRRSMDGQTKLVFGSRPPPAWQLELRFHSESRFVRRLHRERKKAA